MLNWEESQKKIRVYSGHVAGGKYVIAGDVTHSQYGAVFYSSLAGEQHKEDIGAHYKERSNAEKACEEHYRSRIAPRLGKAKTPTLDITNNPDITAIVGMEEIKGDIIIATTNGVYWLDGHHLRTAKLKRIEFEG